jgi:Calcineurin-like phosphoesterase
MSGAEASRSPLTAPPGPRQPIDRRGERGPFDLIGDVHGCIDELQSLLERLGYGIAPAAGRSRWQAEAPAGRRAVFVGDLVDRGPSSASVLALVMDMVADGTALAVVGNHDDKLRRALIGRQVALTHGLEATLAEMKALPEGFRARVRDFVAALPSHLWLDGGRLVVAHAGIKPEMFGRDDDSVRRFCLYGDVSGGRDAQGLPVRYNWAARYSGAAAIVYGHTPVPAAEWQNNTLCLDTGCAFGGRLSALRWPECEIVSVPAREAYARRIRPFGHPPDRPGH